MNIAVFGTGYVGLVTGTCLAEIGHTVMCVDVDKEKIELLDKGGSPIYEPGINGLIAGNAKVGRLSFTTDTKKAVEFGEVHLIAVGTPPDEDGSADLQYVLSVARSIGMYLQNYAVVVDKSTVPVGTAEKVREAIQNELKKRGVDIEFDVASNPEFLKEGEAIEDFMKPDRFVVGVDSERAEKSLREMYEVFDKEGKVIVMDIPSAELTKYAANSLLATKISFMNDLSNLAEKLGADIESVRIGIGSDSRIGMKFINPGAGYGGSCFPKDVKALLKTSKDTGHHLRLLQAVEDVNESQKYVIFEKIKKHFNSDLNGKTFALWGLAFKPNTNDMREASSRVLMESLWEAGAKVQAYDPVAIEEAERIYGKRDDLILVENAEKALVGADALIIITEWNEFQRIDFDLIKATLRNPVIFDGRNLFDPKEMKEKEIVYHCIGRCQ